MIETHYVAPEVKVEYKNRILLQVYRSNHKWTNLTQATRCCEAPGLQYGVCRMGHWHWQGGQATLELGCDIMMCWVTWLLRTLSGVNGSLGIEMEKNHALKFWVRIQIYKKYTSKLYGLVELLYGLKGLVLKNLYAVSHFVQCKDTPCLSWVQRKSESIEQGGGAQSNHFK